MYIISYFTHSRVTSFWSNGSTWEQGANHLIVISLTFIDCIRMKLALQAFLTLTFLTSQRLKRQAE